MKVKLIPALEDNYMYLLIDETSNECAAVDPVEPEKVLEEVAKNQLNLTTVLTTHHHWDHAGGNEKLHKLCPHLKFFGADDRIKPSSLIRVKNRDIIKVGRLNVECLFTPCHTTGSMCYFVADVSADPVVFTGDTLFTAGSGCFFEGTKEQMYHALIEVIQKLPSQTKVYCGHEYTLENLVYARHVEPENRHIASWQIRAQELRSQGLPTVPTTIAEEMLTNPFMRVHEPVVQKHVGKTDPIETMGAVREERNQW